jgi:membrane associated rhomboid family serine protease
MEIEEEPKRKTKQEAFNTNIWMSNVAATFESPEDAVAEGRFSVFGTSRKSQFVKQFSRIKSVAGKRAPSVKNIEEVAAAGGEQTEIVLYKPWFTYGMIGVNVLYLFIILCVAKFQFADFATNPSLGPSPDLLLAAGGKLTSLIINGQSWRLFTSMHIHAGVIHLLINMFVSIGTLNSHISSFSFRC